jgi:SRSO17 transposase
MELGTENLNNFKIKTTIKIETKFNIWKRIIETKLKSNHLENVKNQNWRELDNFDLNFNLNPRLRTMVGS